VKGAFLLVPEKIFNPESIEFTNTLSNNVYVIPFAQTI